MTSLALIHELTLGPVIGAVGPDRINIWGRSAPSNQPQRLVVRVRSRAKFPRRKRCETEEMKEAEQIKERNETTLRRLGGVGHSKGMD